MLSFNVKNLINACQNNISTIDVYQIIRSTYAAYDPECDTELVCSVDKMAALDDSILNYEVQDFYIGIEGNLVIYI